MKETHLDLMSKNSSKSAVQDLQLLKQAMRQASLNITGGTANEATTHEEKMTCAISLLRCADWGDVVGQLRNVKKHPHLRSLVDPGDPFLREKASLQSVRDLVVEL